MVIKRKPPIITQKNNQLKKKEKIMEIFLEIYLELKWTNLTKKINVKKIKELKKKK